jgi:hypothetical protein
VYDANHAPHCAAARHFGFDVPGFFGRWIWCQRLLLVAPGELNRSAKKHAQ